MPAESTARRLQPPEAIEGAELAQWTLDPAWTFLNHGSFGARARPVVEAQDRWRDEVNARPIELLDRRLEGLLDGTKATLGAFLGMRPADFGFVSNATGGVNAVLRSLEFAPGDEVLTTSHVYNAVRNAMRHLIERAGGTYVEAPVPFPLTSADQVVEAIERALTPRTRLVLIDHVTSPTAVIFPVERIVERCRARDVEVMIDGAHAPGMLDLDVTALGATYCTGNLHKWVCAPMGAAFLWVAPERQARIHPCTISHNLDQGLAAEFGWQGTRDVSPWLATSDAIEWLGRFGWERVRAHNHAMALWARAMLAERWAVELPTPSDGAMLGSMATLPVPPPLTGRYDDAQQLRDVLYYEHKIEVPVLEWDRRWWIRISCQVYNTPDDYRRLADVVDELIDGARRAAT